mgnify:CR=1 FL=1
MRPVKTGTGRLFSAAAFFAAMHLHLAASIAAPVGVIATASQRWEGPAGELLLAHLSAAALAQLAGWVCVFCAWRAYCQGRGDALRWAVRLLKLYTIPFYLINFAWSVLCWAMLVGASRGILILFVPIPVLFSCLLVVQSGCVAYCCLRWAAERPGGRPVLGGVWRLLLFVPVLDLFGAVLLLRQTVGPAAPEKPA